MADGPDWGDLVLDPEVVAARVAVYGLAHRLDGDGLARWLGISQAQLTALFLEPRPKVPEDIARLALRYGIAAHKLQAIAETPLPRPETAD
jgi:hypothetical protein